MRWKARAARDPCEWHIILCLIPRVVDDTWVWLEIVYRRKFYSREHEWWEYRLPE